METKTVFAMYLLWLAIILIRKKRYVVSIALFVVIPFFSRSSLVVMVISSPLLLGK